MSFIIMSFYGISHLSRHCMTFLLRNTATLLLWYFLALTLWYFFALLLGNTATLLLWYCMALLMWNVHTMLLVDCVTVFFWNWFTMLPKIWHGNNPLSKLISSYSLFEMKIYLGIWTQWSLNTGTHFSLGLSIQTFSCFGWHLFLFTNLHSFLGT